MPATLATMASSHLVWGEGGLRGVPTVVLIAFLLDVALGVAHLVNMTGALGGGAPRLMFDLGQELNPATWWSSVQLFGVGLLLAVAALRPRRARLRDRLALSGLPMLAFLLSIDEVSQLHERLGRVTRSEALPVTGVWPLVLGPALLLVFAVLLAGAWPILRRRRGATARLGIGLLLLVATGAGLELGMNVVDPSSARHGLLTFLEEMGEMLGATLMLWGAHMLALGERGLRALVDAEG